MTFNSFQFVGFFAAVFPIYWLLGTRARQNLFLLVASYVFYAWWDWRFLFLLAGTTIVDFAAVKQIHAAGDDERRRRGWMIFSVAINLTVLSFFKYFGFFVDSLSAALRHLGVDVSDPVIRFTLPVGISFYVFHEISYAVDVYRRRCEPETNLVTYGVFIAFFPQLVAGPITRASHMLPQFREDRHWPTAERAYSAGVLILTGLFKKVVIGDSLVPYVNEVFNKPSGHGPLPLMIAAVGFSIHIYGDFAGYTDIARGVARLLGIELARNFEQPYLSRNITQFWRTWHISLSSWLHDYLYVPLGGNRGGKWATYRNLMVTMLLGGLWHGASWHFVVWGGLNGFALAAHRATGGVEPRGRPDGPRWRDAPAILANFTLVTVFWVFFASKSLQDVWHFFGNFTAGGLLGPRPGAWWPNLVLVVGFGTLMFVMDVIDRHRIAWQPLTRTPAWIQGALCGAAIIGLIVCSGAAPTPFVYFQF